MMSLSYLEQLSQALQQHAQVPLALAPQPPPAAAAAPPAQLEWAAPAEYFPPPAPLPPPPEAQTISAANPFRFIARPAEPAYTSAAAASSSSSTALPAAGAASGNSFAEDFQRVQLAQRAADNAKQVAALQARRAAAAARDAETDAVARAAQRIISQARRGSSSARSIPVDVDAPGGAASSIGTHEADDEAQRAEEDDLNDAPLPSNFGKIRPREEKSGGKLPASKSEWSLRQQLMPRAQPTNARAAAHAPPAVTVAQRDARVGKAVMSSQSRWVSKAMQADESRAAARKEAQRAALAQSVRTAPGVAQVARMPPAAAAAAAAAAAPRLPHTAGFGSIAKAPHLRPAAVAAAAATPLAMSAALKRKRDAEESAESAAAKKKPALTSRSPAGSSSSLAPSATAVAAAAAATSVSSTAPSRRIPKKTASAPGAPSAAAAASSAAAAAAAAASPAAAASSSSAAAASSATAAAAAAASPSPCIPVIPLPRTLSCPIPTSLRQGFVDALLALCLRHHADRFDAQELHPSLPSNALLLRCEWELLEKTLRHKAAVGRADLQLATYRESSRLVLQLMRDEKDIVAVSKLIATL